MNIERLAAELALAEEQVSGKAETMILRPGERVSIAGVAGPEGPQGPAGETVVGPRGVDGEQGPQGIPGEIGPIGPQGIPGNDGRDGQDGKLGAKGPKGDPGRDGESITGPKGERGPSGPRGPAGARGGGGGGGGGGSLAVLDEAVSLTTSASSLDFAGAGVTATAVGNAVTVTIPGTTGDFIPQGGPLTEDLHADAFQIIDLGTPTDANHAATKDYVDTRPAPALDDVLDEGADADGVAITGLADPTDPQDAATKAYVDANGGIPQGGPLTAEFVVGPFEIVGTPGGAGLAGEPVIIRGGTGDAGNDEGGLISAGEGDGEGSGGSVQIKAGNGAEDGSAVHIEAGRVDDSRGGDITAHGADLSGGGPLVLMAGRGDVGLPGGVTTIKGGAGSIDADSPAQITLGGGDGAGNAGRVEVTTNGITGDAGDLLTAQGDGTALWVPPDFDAAGAAAAAQAASQPVDSDLTAIAALTPSNDDIIQRKAGAWTNRTMAQLAADLPALGLTAAQVGARAVLGV